jgi:ribosome biogenesis GTPase A
MEHGLPVSAPNSLLREIARCMEEPLALPAPYSGQLTGLREKLESQTFNLVVVGEFKRGKSSVINALIGADLLPVGVVPLTAIATILAYGEQTSAQVLFQNGERRSIPPQELREYVTEKGNPRNAKAVAEVRLTYPSDWLRSGVQLVDTPGIGSVYRHNSDVTYGFLPKADAVLFLLSVDQPVGQAEYDFLKKVGEYAGKIFFLLNKADLLDRDELEESVEFSTRVIAEALGRPTPVYPVSARLALEGQAKRAPDLLEQSRFPAFFAALSRFLMEEKGNALAVSVAKNLLRLVVQARFANELALASLATPLTELQRKMAAFEKKRSEMEQDKRDFAILLEAEVKRLADREVTADVEDFKAKLMQEVEVSVRAHFDKVRSLPSHELHEELQRHAVDKVRLAWDGFRRNEDEKLEAAFQALCARFSGKTDETVDELYRFSSELFAVPFEAAGAEADWNVQSGFYYKFWETPGSLMIVGTSLLHALPKFLGDALICKEAERYGTELADTQAGRIRYDFAQRLDKSMRSFKSVMLGRIDATLESITAAMQRGTEIGATGAGEVEARHRELVHSIQALDELAARLKCILEQAGATNAND